MTTGAWTELRTTGQLGRESVALIYATVDAVRRFHRYPPPEGSTSWTKDETQDVAHTWLSADGATRRLGQLVATATSEESFERLLHTAIHNHFRMEARTTGRGRALRAITHAVDNDDAIVTAGATPATKTWSLEAHAGNDGYTGSLHPLVEAAHAVRDVRQAKWRLDAKHQPPIAEPDSLRRVIHAVLDTAGGPVTPQQLLDVIVARFPLAVGETEADLNEADNAGSDISGEDTLAASAIWAQLNDNERLVIGLADESVRGIQAATGLSRGTAHRAVQSASATVATCLEDEPEALGIMRALKDASAKARSVGTEPKGSASTTSKEGAPDARTTPH